MGKQRNLFKKGTPKYSKVPKVGPNKEKKLKTRELKCMKCSKHFQHRQNSIRCDKCEGWLHVKCSGLKLKEFHKIDEDTEFLLQK